MKSNTSNEENLVYVFDIDGTITIDNGDSFHVTDDGKFIQNVSNDTPIYDMKLLIDSLYAGGGLIVYCTARYENVRKQTITWLKKHDFAFDHLYMRKNGDYRRSSIVKLEYMDEIKNKHGYICSVFENNLETVKLLRHHGYNAMLCDVKKNVVKLNTNEHW